MKLSAKNEVVYSQNLVGSRSSALSSTRHSGGVLRLTRQIGRVIDRMRKEVETVTRGILGLLTKQEDFTNWEGTWFDPFCKAFDAVFYSPVYKWRLFGIMNGEEGMAWQLQCCLDNAMKEKADLVVYYTSTRGAVDSVLLCLQDVQGVHSELPVFINEMVKQFPFLTKRLQPLLDAADYAEKNGW